MGKPPSGCHTFYWLPHAAGTRIFKKLKAYHNQEEKPLPPAVTHSVPSLNKAFHCVSWQKRNVYRLQFQYHKAGQRKVELGLRNNKQITSSLHSNKSHFKILVCQFQHLCHQGWFLLAYFPLDQCITFSCSFAYLLIFNMYQTLWVIQTLDSVIILWMVFIFVLTGSYITG